MAKNKDQKVPLPYYQTPLTSTLLLDPGGGGIYDADPFGSYVLAGQDGEVDRVRTVHAQCPSFEFVEAYYLERAILRMFLSIAKHTGRYMVVTDKYLPRFVGIDYSGVIPETKPKIFGGTKIRKLVPSAMDAAGIPDNIGLTVSGFFPEILGRVAPLGDKRYAVLVFGGFAFSAVELVPAPYGHTDAKPERLPAFD